MTEDNEDLSYQEELRRSIDTAKKRIESFEGSIELIMSCALAACQEIHIVYSLEKYAGSKTRLLAAMHSALVVAEQCRLEMAKERK